MWKVQWGKFLVWNSACVWFLFLRCVGQCGRRLWQFSGGPRRSGLSPQRSGKTWRWEPERDEQEAAEHVGGAAHQEHAPAEGPPLHTHTHTRTQLAALIWQMNWPQSVFLCRTWSCSPRNWFGSAKTAVLLAAQPDQSEFIWSFPSFYLDYCSPTWKVWACTRNSSLAFPHTTWSCSHLPISVFPWAAGAGTLSSAPLGCFWMYKN